VPLAVHAYMRLEKEDETWDTVDKADGGNDNDGQPVGGFFGLLKLQSNWSKLTDSSKVVFSQMGAMAQ
jgi:hypothetical protein